MSAELTDSSESQSTLSSLDRGGSDSKPSDKDHDLSRSLNLLALSTEPQQVAPTSPRSCASSRQNQVSSPRSFAPRNTGILHALLHCKPQAYDLTDSRSLTINKFIKKFRQSNRYPPLGPSFDLGSFRIVAFVEELERFMQEMGGDADDEDGKEVELDQIPHPYRDLIYLQAQAIFYLNLISPDIDTEVREFWNEFSKNLGPV
ncbi:hypothetical protein JCM5350_007552 [Sporobolomyces pararoseus]